VKLVVCILIITLISYSLSVNVTNTVMTMMPLIVAATPRTGKDQRQFAAK